MINFTGLVQNENRYVSLFVLELVLFLHTYYVEKDNEYRFSLMEFKIVEGASTYFDMYGRTSEVCVLPLVKLIPLIHSNFNLTYVYRDYQYRSQTDDVRCSK